MSGGGKTRIWFTPIGSEILGIDGGQLWYGDQDGLGSVADLSKCFTPGSIKLASDDEPCRHTVREYDERGWATCRLCWALLPKETGP